MAKSAKFDRQVVVDKATNLYWKKGFHATSMRNLQDEIDMRPGSIYAAFGNKDGLFKETLKHYTETAIAQLQQCINEHASPVAALKAFVTLLVIDAQVNAPNGMCMLAKTISELTEEDKELIDTTKGHLGEIANEFVKLVKQGQELGEIGHDKNPEDIANHIQVQIAGLRTFAKISDDKSKLETMINNVFIHYPFTD